MRAAVFDENGGPDVVRVREVDTPDPGPGEVRVRVVAAALNHLDLWVRRGLPSLDTSFPHVGGSDIAGEVDAVGPGVEGIEAGTRVVVDPSLGYGWYDGVPRGEGLPRPRFRLLGEHTWGGLAEYAVVPADNLVEVPGRVSLEEAAAASLVSVTAWHGLMVRGGLRAGEEVLVTAASGGVGSTAVQMAAWAGATVHAVTSGPDNAARVRKLGATHVYDRLDDDWGRALRHVTGRRGVDLALDSVGRAGWETTVRALAVGGRLVTYGATTGPEGAVDIRLVFWRQLSILGSTMGTPADYRRAMQTVFDGHVRPVIHEVLPLDAAARGHAMLEAGEVFGKVVLKPWS